MDSRKRDTIGVRFADEPSKNEEVVPQGGLPEVTPDRKLIQLRSFALRPDLLKKELDIFSTPFKPYRKVDSGQVELATETTRKRRSGKPKRRSRSLRELRGYQPVRLGFQKIKPSEELDDDWYELVTFSLFVRVYSFVNRFFGDAALFPDEWKTSPWLESLSKEFVWYASKVAKSDPLMGGWDSLLSDPLKRMSLITGILAKSLEANVFSQLLFGADKRQKKMLESQDIATLKYDGYYRTAQRAEAVKACLDGPSSQPHGFWPAVDQLAVQTTAMLLPLINIRGRNAKRKDWPDLCVVYQEVHSIVAEAAFLSNMMRRSSSVFSIEFPSPGEEVCYLDQGQVHAKIFEDSREVAESHDAQELQARMNEGLTAALPRRVGKVHIVLWPIVKRFTPISTKAGFTRKGERISRIIKAQVVYYSGRAGDEDDRRTLFALIRDNKFERSHRPLTVLLLIFWFILFLFCVEPATIFNQEFGWNGF